MRPAARRLKIRIDVVNLVKRLPMVSTLNTLNTMPNATPNIDPNITHNIGPNINPNITPLNATPNATPNEISISQLVIFYSIYMDNYFTSVPLFKELHQQRYEACGTTHPNQVPAVLDDYNHHMNGVDLANQYQAAYTSHRVTYHTWLPILYWLIDSAAINAYRLQYLYIKQQGIPPCSARPNILYPQGIGLLRIFLRAAGLMRKNKVNRVGFHVRMFGGFHIRGSLPKGMETCYAGEISMYTERENRIQVATLEKTQLIAKDFSELRIHFWPDERAPKKV
ncbi:predicted protein [Histoplasma mississippiense (nom. inval.)]|uniref:predicted protein n=1 Tax=Ajellomyces capsulatus (strain NAm1 / WU24) TaxID=2059318 RepID=UPI000157D568|nr:predicted protein [Histoplasma mississippiense (nom. inval.)]EDN05424.1 predicted protein [Histoplasma mississippiense (nom. inval.)]